jgi:hypothetical protein
MKRQSRRTLCAAGLITAALASGAFAQQQEEKLGTLSFPTSCDPQLGGLGRVKTKSNLVVMPSGRQIFAFFLLSA